MATDGLSVSGRTARDLVAPDVPAWLIARTVNEYVRLGLNSRQTYDVVSPPVVVTVRVARLSLRVIR
jgi:hypothetical protein